MTINLSTTLVFRFMFLNLSLLALAASAASQTADLTGAIQDSSQAAVVGATITVQQESIGRKQVTSSHDQGLYRFAFLPPGSYTITVEAAGFGTVSRAAVKLDPGQQARLDFTLVPARLEQTVTIRGSGSFVPSESSVVGTEIDPQLVRDLPLNGRTFQSLIALVPGVVLTSSTQGYNSTGQFSVNGQRDTANYFTVDGVSANVGMSSDVIFVGSRAGGAIPAFNILGATHNLVSVDAMQEFKLQTSTDTAASSRVGGGHLQVVTRSGSNEFHGSAFDYFRNEALDANDWFANFNSLPRAPHRQNDFGGTLGGPIFKDRTFFFFSYEGLRLQLPSFANTLVPSLAARQAASGAIAQLLNAYPLPTGPDNPTTMLAPYTVGFSNRTSSDNTSIRIDHLVGQRLALFGRYSEAPSEARSPQLGRVVASQSNFRSLTLGATVAFSPRIATDLRINYSRTEAGSSGVPSTVGGAVPPPDSLIFPAPFASSASSLFTVHGLNPLGLALGRTADNLQRQGNVVSNTSVFHGSHEVRFGFDYRYLAPHYGPRDYVQNVFFSSVAQALSGVAARISLGTSDPITVGFHNLSLYGQDSWKVTPRLTLTYGLRWELNPPPHAKGNQQLFTLTGFPDLANVQLAPAGTPVYATTYTNFAPRLGAAYQIFGHPGRETVIRGGFGIFYDLGIGNIGNAARSFPHNNGRLELRVPYPLSSQNAAPPPPVSLDPPYSASFNVFGPGHDLPRSYQWNLTVDQKLGPNQVISASYVGEGGRRLLRESILVDPNPRFDGSAILLTTNDSSSDYHALQVQFQRRMARGLSALLSYTWSHSTDDVSLDELVVNPFAPRVDHGASDFDVRHAFKAAFTYNLPAGNWNTALRAVLNNWSIDTIFTARTALPVDVTVDRGDIASAAAGDVPTRPDLVAGVPIYLSDPTVPGGRRINLAAFSVPLDPRQGNLGRNAFRGFPLTQIDFDLRRQFSITEKVKLQSRVDFFNLFNHANFSRFDGNLGFWGPPLQPNPSFGTATSTAANGHDLTSLYSQGGPRSIQLSLRLHF